VLAAPTTKAVVKADTRAFFMRISSFKIKITLALKKEQLIESVHVSLSIANPSLRYLLFYHRQNNIARTDIDYIENFMTILLFASI
jgi:hypothetical protein